MIKAVIFDLDDTLYPESAYVESGFSAVAKYLETKYNFTGINALLKELFKQNKNNVYGRAMQMLGIDEGEISKLVEIYRNNKPSCLPYFEDALPAFEMLKARGIKIGIITDGRVIGQENKINALNLKKITKDIIITDSLGGEKFRKPHPLAFELMSQKLGISYDEMLYVGDNRKKDFYIKTTYPIITVEINRKNGFYSNEDYLEGVLPDYLIESLDQIKDLL